MKKLMTTIAAATAAFGLYAADPVEALHGASMEANEDYVVGQGVVGVDDYWVTDADADESVVTAYGEETAPDHLNYDLFGDGLLQENYLKVEAEQPLYRAIATPTGTTTDSLVPAEIDKDEEGNERDGIIIDQLVKFSAFDAESAPAIEEGAKIAAWVKAGDDDDTKGTLQITTATLDEYMVPGDEPTIIDTEIAVDTAKWYQLKITAIVAAQKTGESGKVNVPGFTIEIAEAGEPLLPVTTDVKLFSDDATGYTAQAEELIDAGKLFPSMVAYNAGAGANALFGVAYKGTGSIDDVAVANYVAEVPPAPTYTLAVTAPSEEEGTLETDPAAGQIAAGTEVTVTATPSEGYELVSITTNGQVLAGITFEMPAEDVTVAATFKASEPDPTVIDPEDPSLVGKKATDVFTKISTDFANVDAKKFAQWCQKDGNKELVGEGGADAMLDAFLLDCLNDTDVIEEAKKDFVIESIEYDALTEEWIVLVKDEDAETTAYKNGYVQIIDAEELADAAEEGVAEFFRAKLVAEPAE